MDVTVTGFVAAYSRFSCLATFFMSLPDEEDWCGSGSALKAKYIFIMVQLTWPIQEWYISSFS